MINRFQAYVIFAALLFCISPPIVAHADAGLPLVLPVLFIQIPALVLVVGVEVHVMATVLKTQYRQVWRTVAFANVFTTIIGIPLTWMCLLGIQMIANINPPIETFWGKFSAVTWQAPWMSEYSEPEYSWIFPTAFMLILIPFCITSIIIEYGLYKTFLDKYERKRLLRASVIGNIASYLMLELIPLSWLIFGTWW